MLNLKKICGRPVMLRRARYAFRHEFYLHYPKQNEMKKLEKNEIIVLSSVQTSRYSWETCSRIITSKGVQLWMYFRTENFELDFVRL